MTVRRQPGAGGVDRTGRPPANRLTPEAAANPASGRPADVVRTATARVPTRWGEFRCHVYESVPGGVAHLAFEAAPGAGDGPMLVRIHSECLTGDVFGSVKCDCGPQLDESMRRIAEAGRGVVVYLRGHEGRGIGLSDKLRAYALQDAGLDTVDANLRLGLPVDGRHYGVAAAILADLEVTTVRLLTNNPEKCRGLEACGLTVAERVPLQPAVHPEAAAYLRTKRERMGHLIAERIEPVTPDASP